MTVRPIFVNPRTLESAGDINEVFVRKNVGDDSDGFYAAGFCEALSLVINHPVGYTVWWSNLGDCEAWTGPYFRSGGSYVEPQQRRHADMEIVEADVSNAMSLFRARTAMKGSVRGRVDVAVDRWMKSKSNQRTTDSFIDLGIALESLYLNDVPNEGELRFRLALRLAWHLGNDAKERKKLFDEARELYDLRSAVVHSGAIGRNSNPSSTLESGQDLCRTSIRKIIEDGGHSDWTLLCLGGI